MAAAGAAARASPVYHDESAPAESHGTRHVTAGQATHNGVTGCGSDLTARDSDL